MLFQILLALAEIFFEAFLEFGGEALLGVLSRFAADAFAFAFGMALVRLFLAFGSGSPPGLGQLLKYRVTLIDPGECDLPKNPCHCVCSTT